MCVAIDAREDHGEDRWIGIGLLEHAVVVVVFTERPGGAIRIISARKATLDERKAFQEQIRDRLAPLGQ